VADIRYVVRSLLAARWFAVGAVLTIALGIGVNAAVFAVVDRVLFRPLPYAQPDQLVTVHPVDPKSRQVFFTLPGPLVSDARQGATGLGDVAYAGNSRPFQVQNLASTLRLTDASFNVLEVSGVRPEFGRGFQVSDVPSIVRPILLRDEIWHGRFGSDAGVVGRTFALTNGGFLEVIGILPAGFIVPSVNWATPCDGLVLARDLMDQAAPLSGSPAVFGRLRPGATVATVQQEFNVLIERLQENHRDSTKIHVLVEPMQIGMFWNCRVSSWLLFLAATLVWMTASVNLGTLVVARSRSREQQTAIRVSLGAPTKRIIRLVVAEIGTLCVLGGLAALGALAVGLRALATVMPSIIQPMIVTTVDMRLALFALLTTSFGALLAALYPAWRAVRVDPMLALQRGRMRPAHGRPERILLIVESAVGTTLAIAGLLTIESFTGLTSTELGFAPRGLYGIALRNGLVPMEQALAALRSEPGITDASAADVPVAANSVPALVNDGQGHLFVARRVFDHYFETMRTPSLAGRVFSEGDLKAASPVAVVSLRAAASLWPGVPPSSVPGRTVHMPGDRPRTVIGVVANTRDRQALDTKPEFFVPAPFDETVGQATILVRVRERNTLNGSDVRRALGDSVDPQRAGVDVYAFVTQLEPWLRDPQMYARLFGAFGVISVLLASIGLFAVARFDVAARRFEIGVRVALGATQGQIELMVLKDSLVPVLLGIALGWVGALSCSHIFQALLYGVSARSLEEYGVVGAALMLSGILATWYPAKVASGTDAVVTLRQD
jgi:putative ABC transport system permease protein